MQTSATFQDFNLLNRLVVAKGKEIGTDKNSLAFMPLVVEMLLNISTEEAEDSITDSYYIATLNNTERKHDKGIDAIYIDEQDPKKPVIHLFNFKYTEKYGKIDGHFPSSEVDKISTLINKIMYREEDIIHHVNHILAIKIKEIWQLMEDVNVSFIIHLTSNQNNSLENNEKLLFEKSIEKYGNIKPSYETINTLINSAMHENKKIISAKIKAIDRNVFDKSDGDIKALIADVDVRDLLRICLDDEDMRNNVSINDYNEMVEYNIEESVFEDNVRIYLKQRSKINKGIKETALSSDAHRFFYYNNGITITCSSFNYPKQQRSPIIELENFQVVNGGQTIHSLYEAFREDNNNFGDMDILCRIYETKNEKLSTEIAEYTNSQNPVSSRDIRSNDYLQRKLEKDLLTQGYFYERKKNQYQNEEKPKRIDAEKAGQALWSFFHLKPGEAKNLKRKVFGEEYENIFHDELNSEDIILSYEILSYIDEQKKLAKKEIANGEKAKDYILHANYYIMYTIAELANSREIELIPSNKFKFIDMYSEANNIVAKAAKNKEQSSSNSRYTHRVFFNGNEPKRYIDKEISQLTEEKDSDN